MKLFTQVPLNIKLFLSGILPIMALLYFFHLIYEQKKLQIANTENFTTRLDLSSRINILLEDLRQERRASLNKIIDENLRDERDKDRKSVV